MKKFALQRVLELKERREQAIAVRLVEARTAADAARGVQAVVEKLRTDGGAQRFYPAGVPRTVGQLQNASYLLQRLDQQIDEARLAVRAADAKVQACFVDFTAATRERRVLDRLKERRIEEIVAAELDVEQKTMDDLALSRFTRAMTTSEGESA